MRRLVLCLTLAFALLGCEGSTEADSGPNQGSGPEAKPAPKASKAPIRNLPQVDTGALENVGSNV